MDDDRRAEQAFDRAQGTHTVWLNEVFRYRDSFWRVFGSGTRISGLDVFWMAIILIVWIGMGFLIRSVVGNVWMLFDPFIIIAEGVIIAWFLGRRVAHMSPLKRKTGEGTSIWLVQQSKRVVARISSLFRGDVTYNVYPSFINGKWANVECVEWLGSAKAPRAPHYDSEENNAKSDLVIRPRGVQNNWIKKN